MHKGKLPSWALNLRKTRRDKGLSQAFVAEMVGLSKQSSYQRYEAGLTIPPPDKLAKLADLFGVTTDYLLGREASASVHGVAAEQAAREVMDTARALVVECGNDWPRLGRLKEHLDAFEKKHAPAT
jgi:transcriptional regulator with XRE-family HTH domain